MILENGRVRILCLLGLTITGSIIWILCSSDTATIDNRFGGRKRAIVHEDALPPAITSAREPASHAPIEQTNSIVARGMDQSAGAAVSPPADDPSDSDQALTSPATTNHLEVRASRAMYMAHAPLRSADIASPDSESNRRILQSMVEKGISRQK